MFRSTHQLINTEIQVSLLDLMIFLQKNQNLLYISFLFLVDSEKYVFPWITYNL